MKEINLEEEKKETKRKPRKGSALNENKKETKKDQVNKVEKVKKEKTKKVSLETDELFNDSNDTNVETTNFAEELNENNTKKKTTRKLSPVKISLLVIYLILCAAVIYGGYFLGNKYALINITKLNKQDLGINEHAFDEANTNLTREQFNKIKTIAVFGLDTRPNDELGSRSDVNMVISINPTTKSIKMISVPRDTYVQIKGTKDKMGHAYFYGGPTLALNTLNQNFGLNITDYATIDFVGVINAINKLGGLELEITEEERLYINERCHESYAMSKRPTKLVKNSGKVLLTGEQILTHTRNRTVGNDFSRAERQRNVLQAIIKKLSTKNLSEIMDLIDTMLKEVETNANVTEYMAIIPSVLANKDQYLSNIISAQCPSINNITTPTINGISYVVPKSMPLARQEFQDYIFNK